MNYNENMTSIEISSILMIRLLPICGFRMACREFPPARRATVQICRDNNVFCLALKMFTISNVTNVPDLFHMYTTCIKSIFGIRMSCV